MSRHIPTEESLELADALDVALLCPWCPLGQENDLRFDLCPNAGDICLDCCGEHH